MSNIFSFTPVPRTRNRHDGWTDQKQQDFVDALATCGVVRAAAEQVGMSSASAYNLRHSEDAESFAEAWDKALKVGRSQLEDLAMDRVLNGIAVPQFYKGEQVGERRWFDNRLLMFMLRQTNTRRFGPHAAQYDFVDERLAVEADAKRRHQSVLADTHKLVAEVEASINDLEPGTDPDKVDALYETRNRLHELARRLGDDQYFDPATTLQRAREIMFGGLIPKERRAESSV